MATTQPSTFGLQLRRYREAAGLSQEDLAERAGLAANAIGALERGERRRPYPRTVQMLADALALDETSRREFIAAVPRSTTTAVVSSTTFVGRESELATLRARLARAAAGGGAFVVLAGEAGIGKTRLAREFVEEAQQQGARVLAGRCFDGDWQPPYGPWVEAIGDDVRTRPLEDLRHEMGSAAPYLAQLVPRIRDRITDVGVPSALNPDDERLRMYEAVTRFLLAIAADRPVVVFLDDLHWADPDSLRLLRHASRSIGGARVLILGAYRDPELGLTEDHPLIAALAGIRRECEYDRLALHGLTHDEVSAYLAHTAGRRLPEDLILLIERETSGNPFYAGEVLRHLSEEARAPSDALATDPGVGRITIPEGVRHVVGLRVARLSPKTALVLKDAAALGDAFTVPLLQRLMGLSDGELLDCIDEALEAGLIRVAEPQMPSYEFAHAIVRHTVYDALNHDRRARLHRRVAIALEQTYAERALHHASEIAAHYHASRQVAGGEGGIRFALAAAAHARATFAHDRAASFLRMAYDLTAEDALADRAAIRCRIALAEADALRLDDASRSADAALDALRGAGVEPRRQAEFLVAIARALKDGGATPAVWARLVHRGLQLVQGDHDLLWARLMLLRDYFEPIRSGPIATGRWTGQDSEAVDIARASGDEADYARTLEPLEWRSREETAAVQRLARTWTQPLAILRALEVVARDLVYKHGAFPEARLAGEELLAASQRFGSTSSEAEARCQLAVSALGLGDLAQAQDALARARAVVARLGPSHRLRFTTSGIAIGIAYFLDQGWEELADAAARYATAADAVRKPLGMIGTAYAALCAARLGRRSDALTWIRHLTPAIERAPVTMLVLNYIVACVAATLWELDATEYAAAYRRLLLDLRLAGIGDPAAWGPLELGIARMSALVDDMTEANDYFVMAQEKATALEVAPLRAIAEYDHAVMLMRGDAAARSRAAEQLTSATLTFRELDMRGWLARAVTQGRRLRSREI